jgi:hypothetical protein
VRAAVALADEGAQHLVLRREPLQGCERISLVADGRESERRGIADRLRDRPLEELVELAQAERLEHRVLLGGTRTDVPRGERRQLARAEDRASGHFDASAVAA